MTVISTDWINWTEYKPGVNVRRFGDTLEIVGGFLGDSYEDPHLVYNAILLDAGYTIDKSKFTDHNTELLLICEEYEVDQEIYYTAFQKLKAYLKGQKLPKTKRGKVFIATPDLSRPDLRLNPVLKRTSWRLSTRIKQEDKV
jgi:hypothetical protein